jgi:hypothetical protein
MFLVVVAVQCLVCRYDFVVKYDFVLGMSMTPHGIPVGFLGAVTTLDGFWMVIHVNTVSHIDGFEPCGIVADKPILQ